MARVGGVNDRSGKPAGAPVPVDECADSVVPHTALYLVARGVPGVMAFLAIPMFAHVLEPGDYALYAVAMTAIGTANSLVFEWVRWSIVRCLPTEPAARSAFVSTVLALWLALSAAVAVVAVITLLFPAVRPMGRVLSLAVVVLLAQSMFEIVTELLRADLRPWHFMMCHLVRAVFFVGLGYALLRLGAGWTGPLIAVAMGMVLAVASACRRGRMRIRPRLDPGRTSEMFRYGAPISLTVALAGAMFLADRLLVAIMLGDDAAGLYSVAFDFATQSVTMVMVAVSMAAFPIAVRELETRGSYAARRPMATNATLLLAIGVPVCVGAAVLAPGIAAVMFAPAYAAAAEIMPMVAVGALLAGLKAYHFDTALQFSRRTVHQVWIAFGAVVVNIALNLLMIPSWGLHGAALSSALAFLGALLFTAWWGHGYFPLPFPIRDVAAVGCAGVAMGGVLAPFRHETGVVPLALQVLGGALVYSAVLVGWNLVGVRTLLRHAMIRLRAGESSPDAGGAGEGRPNV